MPATVYVSLSLSCFLQRETGRKAWEILSSSRDPATPDHRVTVRSLQTGVYQVEHAKPTLTDEFSLLVCDVEEGDSVAILHRSGLALCFPSLMLQIEAVF